MTAPSQEHRRSNDSSRGGEPETIRAGINETRERISQDLDQIGERLNPNSIKEEIKEGIRDATIGRVEDMARQAGRRLNDAGTGVVQRIRDKPLPAAIAGVGIAWLLMGKGSNQQRPGLQNEPGTVDKAKEQVGHLASQAQDAVTGVAGPRIDTMRSAFQENPMALAAGAVALGLVFGLMAPPTRPEARILGDVGERVMDKVSEVARDTSEKAQNVAGRVIEETKAAAREEGLTSGPGASLPGV